MDLQSFTGTANIRAADGKVCYTGDIANGAATGAGILYDRKGRLVYNGAFLNNEYSGAEHEYYPSGKIKIQRASSPLESL
jgi:antitoxin component YwqK of YwqJK toxin-antitoxin module